MKVSTVLAFLEIILIMDLEHSLFRLGCAHKRTHSICKRLPRGLTK